MEKLYILTTIHIGGDALGLGEAEALPKFSGCILFCNFFILLATMLPTH